MREKKIIQIINVGENTYSSVAVVGYFVAVAEKMTAAENFAAVAAVEMVAVDRTVNQMCPEVIDYLEHSVPINFQTDRVDYLHHRMVQLGHQRAALQASKIVAESLADFVPKRAFA